MTADVQAAAEEAVRRVAVDADVALAVEGDPRAQRRVLGRLLPRIRNLSWYLASRHPEVEDFAQLALIEVARALPSFRGEGRIERWCDRIVTRTVMSRLKLKRLDIRPIEDERPPEDRSPQLDPRRAEERRELRTRLAHHLGRLNAEKREAVVLKLVLGHSVKEIAEMTGAPVETVRTRLRVGRADLVRMVEKDRALQPFLEGLK